MISDVPSPCPQDEPDKTASDTIIDRNQSTVSGEEPYGRQTIPAPSNTFSTANLAISGDLIAQDISEWAEHTTAVAPWPVTPVVSAVESFPIPQRDSADSDVSDDDVFSPPEGALTDFDDDYTFMNATFKKLAEMCWSNFEIKTLAVRCLRCLTVRFILHRTKQNTQTTYVTGSGGCTVISENGNRGSSSQGQRSADRPTRKRYRSDSDDDGEKDDGDDRDHP
ncbi:hypothetical protein LTS18_001703 [Coniosporium uncinatum]|uniref:Uncharacterized protein n=1 Tax=Coniosporium uncinatum TaxID=93489 RepID=A0ACC3D7Z1_9PEZI|nr:hypothetical protein LTS18_001703 [Coniosporium uncinatum]